MEVPSVKLGELAERRAAAIARPTRLRPQRRIKAAFIMDTPLTNYASLVVYNDQSCL